MAGPTMRATLLVVEPTPTAPVMSSEPTISYMNDDRTGTSKALTVPMAAASTNSRGTLMASVTTSTPSTPASTPASTWVIWRMRQRLRRSARAPA